MQAAALWQIGHTVRIGIPVAPRPGFVIKILRKLVGRINELQNKTSDQKLALVVRDQVCPGRLAASPLIKKPLGVREP
jgi:hypothetical protein